jgi:hypothetical protein
MAVDGDSQYDLFLAHASEDRDSFVVPLVKALRAGGVSVWYSEFESPFTSKNPATDDALHRFLTEAMQSCSFGGLVISKSFLEKPWPRKELDFWLSKGDSEKRLSVVLLGVTIDDVSRSSHTSTKYLEESFAIISADLGASRIAQLMISKMSKRTVMYMKRCKPPTDIIVFPDMGSVLVAQSGGLFGKKSGGDMSFIDFSGRTVTDRADKVLATLWRQLEHDSNLQEGDLKKFKGMPFQFEKDFIYAYFNHLHTQIFTPSQVKTGCYLNVGSNEQPMVITPFFTCDSYTGGVIEDRTTPFIDKCLKAARGSWEGDWRRIVFSEDRKSFQVLGET